MTPQRSLKISGCTWPYLKGQYSAFCGTRLNLARPIGQGRDEAGLALPKGKAKQKFSNCLRKEYFSFSSIFPPPPAG
jgi:hypothetical protein